MGGRDGSDAVTHLWLLAGRGRDIVAQMWLPDAFLYDAPPQPRTSLAQDNLEAAFLVHSFQEQKAEDLPFGLHPSFTSNHHFKKELHLEIFFFTDTLSTCKFSYASLTGQGHH